MLTLDTWFLGWRPRDLANAYLPFLKGEGVANYFSDPVFRAALEKPPEEDPGPAIGHWAYQFANPTVTWADLRGCASRRRLPIVLKGIVHAEDARRAVDAGVDGLLVSNHGGRQVDGSLGALDALPAIRDAVGERAGAAVRQRRAHAARTSSRRSRSAPTRCASGARTCGGWRSAGRRASSTCCAACSPSST